MGKKKNGDYDTQNNIVFNSLSGYDSRLYILFVWAIKFM